MTVDLRFLINRDGFTLDVDLSIPSRGVTALFGPSGCGKTTLLRAIAGLEEHQNHTGYLKVEKQIWQDNNSFIPPHKRPIGYVFQEPSLFDHLTVQRNLEYGMKRLDETARKVSLDQAVSLLGISHLLQRRPQQLSGGEQQRVAIARALAVSPAMLLLDEPLAALDATRKQEILPYLETLHQELEIPVIYVSHSRSEVARLADHLVYLEEGRVMAEGPVGELFSRFDLSLAYEQDAESIIEAVVTGHDEHFKLTDLSFSGGDFTVARNHLNPGSTVRLQVLARDVSLTLERQTNTSILNIFPAVVAEIADAGTTQNLVRLDLAGTSLLARITRKSASLMNLTPGKNVFAQVKTVALVK